MSNYDSGPNDRDPNDDRSDTMNPNNDAYYYDQLNRFGEDDGDE